MELPPLIGLEEHFLSKGIMDDFQDSYQEQFKAIPAVKDKLRDVGDLRLNDMEKGRISFQIISHGCAPGGFSPEQCRDGNNALASGVRRRKDKFAGFAVLPVAYPEECAKELERCVNELGFVGALIDNHAGGVYYDGPEYEVFWRKAEELDVPIYLHPTWAADYTKPMYSGNFSAGASRSLAASGWGWHADCGLHILRLFAAGVFDKFPRLKVVIGHFGEMLPFQLERISLLSARWSDQNRGLKQVWDENIWITTSGVWSLDPMRCILHNTKIDHILFSVDYPFEKNENGLKWVQELEKSGLVTREEFEKICYKNTENLLKIKAPERPHTNGVH